MNISVIIPTYNRYEVLKRALRSVVAQTYKAKEIIVIDDGSSDDTQKIRLDFSQVRYYYQKNSGVSSARNLGIKNANYEWIAFLDSDDEWHKDKLQLQQLFHTNHPSVKISYTDERWIRNTKEVNLPKKFHKHGGDIFERCLSHCIIAPSSTIIQASLLDDIGLFDEELEVCEDYDLWLRISINHPIGLIETKLITKYGGDKDQLSTKHWGMDAFRVKSLEKLLDDINTPNIKKQLIAKTLIDKFTILLKGAKKHDKSKEVDVYKKKLFLLNKIY